MTKISKKQRMALRHIDELQKGRNQDLIWGALSIGAAAVVFFTYNLITYNLGILQESDMVPRAIVYTVAMVVAGFCGIKFMHASKKKREIDGLRQQTGISRDTLEAWKKGEIE